MTELESRIRRNGRSKNRATVDDRAKEKNKMTEMDHRVK